MGKHTKPRTHVPNPNGNPILNVNKNLNLDEGDNSNYIKLTNALRKLPDIDLKDAEQVEQRLDEYFELHQELDMKPTMTGLGMALNSMSRHQLGDIKHDREFFLEYHRKNIPTTTRTIIKKAIIFMENLWEQYMLNGKINPASGIFIGKNHYGYKDVVENVVTPNINQDDYSTDDIKKRYLAEPTTGENVD